MKIQTATPEHFSWIAARAECAVTDSFRAIEAVDDSGQIRGMVGFDGWLGNAAQMHVAIESPGALRALLHPVFNYLFNTCGKGIALGLLPSHRTRALAFDKHVGFREVHRVKDGWAPGDDMILLELRKEDCRWLDVREVARLNERAA